MEDNQKDNRYALHLLEEIRFTLAQNLLVSARIYDKLREQGEQVGAKETPTYEAAEKHVNESVARLAEVHKKLDS